MRARFVWDNEMEGSKGFLKDNGQPWRSWAGSGWLPSCHCPQSCEHVSWRNVSTCMVANCDAIRLLVGIFYQSMSFLFCRFGYPHYLHTKFYKNVQCVWGDVMCRYWPWALAKTPGLTNTPCLSVMHAKAHSWHCQVLPCNNCSKHIWLDSFVHRTCMHVMQLLWGGRWQEGSAASTGEDMEQLFSYLSRLNVTTKNMNAAGKTSTALHV